MPETPIRPSGSAALPWWAAVIFGLVAMLTARNVAVVPDDRSGKAPHSARSPDRKRAGEKAAGAGQGKAASTPSDIPARGWKDILFRVYTRINDDRVLAVAAGVTFYGLLAVFPTIVALVSLYGLFADASTISSHLDQLQGVLPGGAIEIVGEQVKRITSKPSSSLGFGFVFGLAVALWSANAGMKAMFDALNVCYEEKEKRSFIVLNAMSLAFTLATIVALLLIMGAVVVVPVVLNKVPLGATVAWLISLLRWPILYVLVALGLSVLYRFGPSRKHPKWRWVTWGSALAALVWLIASAAFSYYVAHFGSYNETYGSLGAAIGFMTWIWISSTIVLVGAELNAELERQTAMDTTEGDTKPMGARGARMADTVAS